MTRSAFIGDIHGCRGALRQVLARLPADGRELVFLGDYVNRGPESRGVIEDLIELSSSSHAKVSLLAGNHEEVLLALLEDDAVLPQFLGMGGGATIRSYVDPPYRDVLTQFRRAFPDSHRAFLRRLRPDWLGDGVVAVHNSRSLRTREAGSFVVSGHNVRTALVPDVTDAGALIDTGCGTLSGGKLTGLLYPEMTWVQSDVSPSSTV
ncbi:metallophosphoesterase [Plantibacter sp. ME-Dv--P-095]|uniref:metallophosphoesterase n=1 Tax=Plantibacter sp. ME-Dv--P-095 TaxID=3040299 RepID=UPI003305AEFD